MSVVRRVNTVVSSGVANRFSEISLDHFACRAYRVLRGGDTSAIALSEPPNHNESSILHTTFQYRSAHVELSDPAVNARFLKILMQADFVGNLYCWRI